MRKLPGIALLALCLQGCGSDGGACADSPAIGTYDGQILSNADVLTIRSDCSFSSTYCVSEGTVADLGTATSGNIRVTTTTTAGKAGCLPAGSVTCGFSLTNSTLQFSCTAGTLTYTKK